MTTTAKRNTLRTRLGRIFRGGDDIQRTAPAAPVYNDFQRSVLVDFGLAPDATDDDVARFVANMDDIDRADFEREAGVARGDRSSGDDSEPADDVARSDDDDIQTPAAGSTPATPAPAPIQRGDIDVDDSVERALRRRDREDRRRSRIINELDGDDIPRELVQRAMAERWSEERISREFLTASRSRPAPVGRAPAGHVNSRDRRSTVQALQGALLLREGIALDDPILRTGQARAMLSRCDANWINRVQSDFERADDPDREQFERARDNAHNFADIHLVDVCRMALELDGRPTSSHSHEDIVRSAMSTATLSAVFSTSVNMQILMAYMGTPDTTTGWTYETDVNGFHVQKRGRLTKASGMGKLARGGTPRDITFSDETENYAAERYAGRFVIDEQDIIDNILGGVTEHTTRELGEMAREIKINLVYGLLLSNPTMRDSKTLFHADHGNTGTGLGWGLDAYKSVRAAMAKQTESGRHIANRLAHVIAPEDIEFDVLQLLRSGELRQAADSTGGQMGTQNPAQGTATPHFDARLSVGVTNPADSTFYTGSATTWFAANANGRNGIEVGWRRGTGRAPRVEGGPLPVSEGYGMVYRCNVDIGVKAIDWRGLYRAQVS